MLIEIGNIHLAPNQDISKLQDLAEKQLRVSPLKLKQVLKKSLDARKKSNIHYNCRALFEAPREVAQNLINKKMARKHRPPDPIHITPYRGKGKIIVIGSGPAGLFCALRLVEAGARVTILERGKSISQRMKDIAALEKRGELNPESNVLFGEGGAGTYSDGKLTYRSGREEIAWFYDRIIDLGASPEIAYEAKPHIGTDKLQKILINARRFLLNRGAEILFQERVNDFIIEENRIKALRTATEREFSAAKVILAMGHSSRDTYEILHARGVEMEKKGFAMGLRVEHPAREIRQIQYGKSRYRDILPPAEYQLVHTDRKRGVAVYSFCMCPGGMVINSSSQPGMLCTNGMSFSGRNLKFSNSALVVTISPHEPGESPLSGIELQRQVEKKAFQAGGGDYRVPAQNLLSFINGSKNILPEETSYKGGITPAEIESYLPGYITEEIKKALPIFDRKMKGFISSRAILMGPETRTSSPVRIKRGADFQSVNTAGLYPIGEGAGYSGGIVSSAIDGIRCADVIINNS